MGSQRLLEDEKEGKYLEGLRRRLTSVPQIPGVYRWLSEGGEVLYVGKAKNLQKRMKSYVQRGAHGVWQRSLRSQLRDFAVTVTQSELEALILEANLIKELRPKYNVLMKDDKSYVYVRVSTQEPYPRVDVVRRFTADGGRYCGPFVRAVEVHRILDMLNDLYPYRACKPSLDRLNTCPHKPLGNVVPCLGYHIGQCCGLCVGAVSQEVFRERIGSIIAFFRGHRKGVLERIHTCMHEAASERKFERAAVLRDYLRTVQDLEEKQVVSEPLGDDLDVFGVALLMGKVHVVLFKQREGKVIDEVPFVLAGTSEYRAAVLEQFLPQYYSATTDLPRVVLVGEDFPNRSVLEQFLSDRGQRKVAVRVPERGRKFHLLDLAERNALENAKHTEAKWEAEVRNTETALRELHDILHLSQLPRRIECYDISHLGGTETVGSMVVMIDGKPYSDHYRSFTIRTLRDGTIDDYGALREVLKRRLRHVAGGLDCIRKTWKERGVVFRKARKADRVNIEDLVRENPEYVSTDDLTKGQFFVAAQSAKIAGCCCIFFHSTGLRELRSVCIAEAERGKRLGQSMIRVLLEQQKKGKTYIVIDPALEQYYADIGFRHVLKMPSVLEKKVHKILAEDPTLRAPLVMFYDAMQHKPDRSLGSIPDLFLIDGGKGQLNVALDILQEFSLCIPTVALAKKKEAIFIAGKDEPLSLPVDSPGKFLLMRLRDEAHRRAHRHQEERRVKRAFTP